jgi:gamma-glutamyl:cysteine ligase YbdK (ATP-grasp superfamily)
MPAVHEELDDERWDSHKEKHDNERELAQQRWIAHGNEHAAIAKSLAEYKVQSNEWRGSLTDLRGTFVTKDEQSSAMSQGESVHSAMETKMEAIEKDLQRRYDELRGMIQSEREERRDQQNLRTGEREGISRSTGIIVGSVAFMGTVIGIVVVVVNLLTQVAK